VPGNPEIGPPEGDIFETVHERYEREAEEGRLDPDLPEPREHPPFGGMIEHAEDAIDDHLRDIEHAGD
jgi:hypothetical protein